MSGTKKHSQEYTVTHDILHRALNQAVMTWAQEWGAPDEVTLAQVAGLQHMIKREIIKSCEKVAKNDKE